MRPSQRRPSQWLGLRAGQRLGLRAGQRLTRLGALGACLVLLAACGISGQVAQVHGRHGRVLSAAALRPVIGPRVAAIVARMSLPRKVGQLFVAAVPGIQASQGGAELVRRYHLGGVIYFQNNLHNADQVATLSNGLQHAAMAGKPAVPLTVGTDQEGGTVSRLAGIVTSMPSEMAAGATRDPALVRDAEAATGRQLRALGINLDYAPVADVNVDPANPVIGTRSFGANAALVSQMTLAAVTGLHAAGVAAAAKHFPGHGDTDVDSHTGLPVIRHTMRQWRRIDEPPFQAAIRGGVDMIMSAHIVVPALERSRDPATLSHAVITGLLRGKLGYRGVVTTDALQMAGVQQGYGDARAAVRAIKAGCDELLLPPSLATAYGAVLAAVRTGQLRLTRLDQAVTRILTLKAERGLFSHPYVDVGAAWRGVDTVAAAAVARRLADRSVTVVKNAGRVLPVPRGASVYVAGADAGQLAAALERAGLRPVTSAGAARVIVVATSSATDDPAEHALIDQLLAVARPVVLIATGKPYDLGLFTGASAEVATYCDAAVCIRAAAGVLTGAIRPHGKLPVTVPAAGGRGYPFGAGLAGLAPH